MRGKHRKTLNAVLSNPVSGSIKWRDVESLLIALGATLHEAAGSRVLITLNDVRMVFHRPHPQPEMRKYAIRDLRELLRKAGIDDGAV